MKYWFIARFIDIPDWVRSGTEIQRCSCMPQEKSLSLERKIDGWRISGCQDIERRCENTR